MKKNLLKWNVLKQTVCLVVSLILSVGLYANTDDELIKIEVYAENSNNENLINNFRYTVISEVENTKLIDDTYGEYLEYQLKKGVPFIMNFTVNGIYSQYSLYILDYSSSWSNPIQLEPTMMDDYHGRFEIPKVENEHKLIFIFAPEKFRPEFDSQFVVNIILGKGVSAASETRYVCSENNWKGIVESDIIYEKKDTEKLYYNWSQVCNGEIFDSGNIYSFDDIDISDFQNWDSYNRHRYHIWSTEKDYFPEIINYIFYIGNKDWQNWDFPSNMLDYRLTEVPKDVNLYRPQIPFIQSMTSFTEALPKEYIPEGYLPSSINQIEKEQYRIKIIDKVVEIQSTEIISVDIYSLHGVKICSNTGNRISIHLSTGVYIFKINEKSYKMCI